MQPASDMHSPYFRQLLSSGPILAGHSPGLTGALQISTPYSIAHIRVEALMVAFPHNVSLSKKRFNKTMAYALRFNADFSNRDQYTILRYLLHRQQCISSLSSDLTCSSYWIYQDSQASLSSYPVFSEVNWLS